MTTVNERTAKQKADSEQYSRQAIEDTVQYVKPEASTAGVVRCAHDAGKRAHE
jgi:hypothetical protein